MLTKQALGNTLWGMADTLRDKVEDYKSYILTLLFFKRLSDNYSWENENNIQQHIKDYGAEPNEKQKQKIIKDKHDFIIPNGCFWEDVRKASSAKKNFTLHTAVTKIADANPILKGVINTVKWNEPAPDGKGGKKLSPEVLTALINYLNPVDLSNKNVSVDVLGDAYEYLIKRFADENKGGTTAGQFYTPQEVVDIIVRYLKPKKGNTFYDPTCGSGGFLINAAKYIKKETGSQKNIRLFGQDSVWNTWAIANINMILHGLDAKIEHGDTLKKPKFKEEKNNNKVKKFNLVAANFPFSQENWWLNGKPKKDKKGKSVTKKDGSPQLEYPGKEDFSDPFNRFKYGIPPFSNGDFAFIQHIVASLDENGKAGVVCPQGILFRGQPEKTEEEDGQNRKADDEYEIRRGFLQGAKDNLTGEFKQNVNIIDAIVVLPGNLFYGTTIPGAIVFFNKNKPEERKNKLLMVYGAKEGWYKEAPNMNVLLPQDILRISTMLEAWGDVKVAKKWIEAQKIRLKEVIQEDLEFKISEIELDTNEEIELLQEKVKTINDFLDGKMKSGQKPTNKQFGEFEKAKLNLDKLLREKQKNIDELKSIAETEKQAIREVEQELIEMFNDPELRKRYFAIVDMDELEENEFNLNIPRYVDTFEPEEEIDLKQAFAEFKKLTNEENKLDQVINSFRTLIEV